MATNKILPCFENIFGLSRTSCTCTDAGKPNDAEISASGIFLDELEGIPNFQAIENANACMGLWDIYSAARVQGTERMQDDTTIALNTLYKKSKKSWEGKIGKAEFTENNLTTADFVGIRYRTELTRDSVFIINSASIALNASTNGTISVYKGYRNSSIPVEFIAEFEFVSVANLLAPVSLPVPLILPMADDMNMDIDYFLMYQMPVGTQAKNTAATCNCGPNERLLHQYITPQGVAVNNLLELPRTYSGNKFGNGLIVYGEIRCKSDSLLCRSAKDNIEIFTSAAYAARYKAGELVIERILNSPDVSRYTMMNREYLWGKRNHYQKQYNISIQFISQNIDVSGSDCYECGDSRMFKGGIKI